MTFDYISELIPIREFLRTQKIVPHPDPFPYNHCDRAARVVRELTGMQVISGTIKVGSKEYVHTCNYDPTTDVIADITRDQFGFSFPEVIIEPAQNSSFKILPPQANDRSLKRVDALLEDTVKTLVEAYKSN